MKNLCRFAQLALLVSVPYALAAQESPLKQEEHVFLRFNEGTPYTASEGMNKQFLKLTTAQTRGAFTLNEDTPEHVSDTLLSQPC